jgi:hypothetical protein
MWDNTAGASQISLKTTGLVHFIQHDQFLCDQESQASLPVGIA